MYDLFEIKSASGSHKVVIHEGQLVEALLAAKPDIILADEYFGTALADIGIPVLTIDAQESTKDLNNLTTLIEAVRNNGLTRKGHIAAVGGGVVQDVACFIASIYMRGVNWSYYPTTLLAMADSCIGGKSSINVGAFKNLVGTFYPPREVIVVPALTRTLDDEQIIAGLCEAAKICYCRDPKLYLGYENLVTDFPPADKNTTEILKLSLTAKKWFVETDEFDQNERLLLNYGHSFGHALESATDYRLSHGVAVGMGMLAAIQASEMLSQGTRSLDTVVRFERHITDLLMRIPNMPDILSKVDRLRFLKYFGSDKKHSPQEYRIVIVNAEGRIERTPVSRDTQGDAIIWDAFDRARTELTLQYNAKSPEAAAAF